MKKVIFKHLFLFPFFFDCEMMREYKKLWRFHLLCGGGKITEYMLFCSREIFKKNNLSIVCIINFHLTMLTSILYIYM